VGAADDGRLNRLLGHPELAWLIERVRGRIARGQNLDGTVTCANPTPAQRQAVERLLGRAPRPGRTLTVSLPALDTMLRRSGACADGLAAAVVELDGPIAPLAELAAARERAWEQAFAPLTAVVAARPELAGWLERLRASGVVRRVEPHPEEARTLLVQLAAIVAALPADGEPIGRFAARTVGSAHALADGASLTTLALGAARALAGLPPRTADESPAEWSREVWAAVGLLRDELSNVVLVLGLTGDASTATGSVLRAAREAGQPLWLTLRQLVRDPPAWTQLDDGDTPVSRLEGLDISVCENPVVVSLAADRLGARCPPLVCTNGQPVAAVIVLLRQLAAAGARLRYHGDFDWGGLRIGNVLHARLSVEPWRFDTATYERAVARGPGPALRGTPAAARWDPQLGPTMHRCGRRVEEELVVEQLLDDLARESGHRCLAASNLELR
jgi:uncharacterized protein (TIGR02679 family)